MSIFRLNCIRQYKFLFLILLLFLGASNIGAQESKDGINKTRGINYGLPSGYSQVGSTLLCYRVTSDFIDFQGMFGDRYYGSTYSNKGYKVAMKIDNKSAIRMNCLNGTVSNGVKFQAEVVAQADLAQVRYYVTNNNTYDVTISLGTHADVQIGNNDHAPILRKKDTAGNTYGLSMLDGQGAQLCALFGAGLSGVTSVDDFWFGFFTNNSDANNMVGNYFSGKNYMVENGSYDSGMGWCWKNRLIPAGQTVVFCWLIGVGDVKLEPRSSFEVTPDDPEGWNDLSRPHRLRLSGNYESPAGQSGIIDYAVENETEWHTLTEIIESGREFTNDLVVNFDPTLPVHTIRFRTRDLVGNTTILPSIVWPDMAFNPVSGIIDMTYTGDPLYQTGLTCDIPEDHYEVKFYNNNINAGIASFSAEGVFPYTIGRKTYTFKINPAPLTGGVKFKTSEIVYDGNAKTPEWSFTESVFSKLVKDKDFTGVYTNNILPGTATLTITGKNNYEGKIVANFTIDKAPIRDNLYKFVLPQSIVYYDSNPHGASVTVADGVGDPIIRYSKNNTNQTDAPIEPGDYNVYLEIAEGKLYYGLSNTKIGSFSIVVDDLNDYLNSLHDTQDDLNGNSYTRQFLNTDWQALYVPFSLSFNDWSDKFEVASMSKFCQYDDDKDGNPDRQELEAVILRSSSDKLKANTPYLIRAKVPGTYKIAVEASNFVSENVNTVTYSAGDTELTVTGNYVAQNGLKSMERYRLLGGSLSIPSKDEEVLPPYRWYATIGNSDKAKVRISFVDNATGIEPIDVDTEEIIGERRVYDLSGRRINISKDTPISSLPKGIYIINNKKFIIK
jgi:hypothetical protein